MNLQQAGQFVLKTLNEAGYEAFFVGGMVRDQLLNRPIYDIDVTTSAHPNQVQDLFEKTYETGIAHGTITVVVEQIPVEVTTYRVESDYDDFRHPNEVAFTASLEEDLLRRDFTMNAIAMDLAGELHDPLGGLEDLKSGIISAVGKADQRFREDPLRILRGIRFVSKLGFEIQTETYEAIKNQKHLISHLAKERIKKEFEGIMLGVNKEQALNLLFELGILEEFENFHGVNKFKNYSFSSLSQGLDFFVLVGLEVGDIENFLNQWPFSKQEKKLIKLVYELTNRPMPKAFIQYRFGVDAVFLYHRIQCFLNQEETDFIPYELVIENRKELKIKVGDLVKTTGFEVGPWTGKLLEEIEVGVVEGHLANNKDEILEFVLKRKDFI